MQEQVLYQIFKLTTTFICENNLEIIGFDIKKAACLDKLVSCGDNIAFAQARMLRGDTRDPKQIFHYVMTFRQRLRRAKKDGDRRGVSIYNKVLTKMLFNKDFVVVDVVKKSEYKKIAKNGFCINGTRYVRFAASAGNIRRNCAIFCAADIYPDLYKHLMCGLDDRVKSMNIAKLIIL